MYTVETTFEIPVIIEQGLLNGTFERVGGIVRNKESKQIVSWLREISNAKINETGESILPDFLSLSSVGSVSSILNLAVSTMGFSIVLQRLGIIEQQLQQAQDVLQTIDYKIDLSFYANFRAALDLAINAFTMSNSETRKMSAMQAINRFLEAEHHYIKLTDKEINNGSQVADEYLSTLCLAFLTEVRCYLELEEIETAHRRLIEGSAILRPRFEKHIKTLLTSNPAAYLHPMLKGKIGLKHLTKIYQWLDPGLNESDVFEMNRENYFKLDRNNEEWARSLPQAIRIMKERSTTQAKLLAGISKQSKKFIDALPSMSKNKSSSSDAIPRSPETEAYGRLSTIMELMDTMVENYNRFAMYESEVEMIHQLGMEFKEWKQLKPSTVVPRNGGDLIYITVK